MQDVATIVKDYQYSNDFSLTTQLKSWMAINPSYGCIWDCAYCIQHKDAFFDKSDYKKVMKIRNISGGEITPEEVVAEIMTNPRITNNTPLAFYNFSDPFLPQNKRDLISILKGLDNREFRNPIGLITRTFADNETVEAIAQLENIKPVIIVSYAGYSNKEIESAPNSKRVEMMKRFHDAGVPILQYMRPLVKEWMEEGQIEKARDTVIDKIDGVVMSGIRLTPEIISKIQKRNVTVPFTKNYENKYFPESLQEEVVKAYDGVAPVFRYTSCAVSTMLERPDYNAHLQYTKFTNKTDDNECKLPCKSGQSKICAGCKTPLESTVKELLSKIDKKDVEFEIKNEGVIYVKTEMDKQEKTFLRHNTSNHVESLDEEDHKDQVYVMKS